MPRIDGVKGVFRVDEGGDAALLLGFGYRVEREGRLAGGFRSVDFDDASAGEASHAEGHVQLDAARRDDRDVLLGLAAQGHDGTFSKVLLDLRDGGFDGFCLFGRKRLVESWRSGFLCHDFLQFGFVSC